MDTLEDYLASDYLAHQQEIATIDRTLETVVQTFCETFKIRLWPYSFPVRTAPSDEPRFSQGTQAMVLTATGRMLGHCRRPKGTFTSQSHGDLQSLQNVWSAGLMALIRDLKRKKRITSGTFGDNNPLTLSQISELQSLLNKLLFGAQSLELKKCARPAAAQLKKLLRKDLTEAGDVLTPGDGYRYYINSFVPLRALRAAQDLQLPTTLRTKHRRFFESTLHDHLSFSSIPDSRFDAAELAFCLEGLLLCAPEAVDPTLFDRVLAVLGEKQNTSAHWRPSKPFLASPTGSINLPLSVEVANSLMRSTAVMDTGRLYDTFTSKTLPLIQRFWHWLRARSMRFDCAGKSCVGWHSEHVNDPDVIHTWDTSQVAEFMIAFREMLERHVATTSLRLSRLALKTASTSHGKIGDDRSLPKWSHKAEKYEPALGRQRKHQIYGRIGKDFVDGWSSDNPRYYSMLLYGPPGTGKSTLAENLADALGMPLITVTVSDFLGAGGANVEARAKALFLTLEAQERCVILFDEIDSFLLDRNTKLYRDQDSLFQFLTPGMLTKINDLRKQKRSIFVIATNYENRIDPAIKRTGRIDKQYLVPLPDSARRMRIMEDVGLGLSASMRRKLVKETAFLAYSDLKGALDDAGGPMATASSIAIALGQRSRATSLDSYMARLDTAEERFPTEEFLYLLHEATESGLSSETRTLLSNLSDERAAKLAMDSSEDQLKRLSGYGFTGSTDD